MGLLMTGWTVLAAEGYTVEFLDDAIQVTRTARDRSMTAEDVERVKEFVRPEDQHMVFKADYATVLVIRGE